MVGDVAQGKEAIEKAYALKDRVSEHERLDIEHFRYTIRGDEKKVLQINELLARRYPRDPVARANLAGDYLTPVSQRKRCRRPRRQSGTAPRLSRDTSPLMRYWWI
jgi:hypothetical protein